MRPLRDGLFSRLWGRFLRCASSGFSLILVGVMAYGMLSGVARVMQGGHFPTDVLWSGILILMIVATLYFLVLRIPESV